VSQHLTVTLLSPGTGSLSSELLGLHSSGVGDQQGSVVLDQSLLELEGGSGVLVLGEVSNDTLGNSLPQGVDLGNVTTSLDSETDVNSLEPLDTNGEDGLVDLVSEDGRLDDRDGRSVEPDQTLTGSDESDGGGGL